MAPWNRNRRPPSRRRCRDGSRRSCCRIPGPARSTLAQLIVGAMLAQGGPVTRAVLALTPRLGWQAYHWMLARGRFRLLGLVAALCGIVQRETCGPRRFGIINDTLAPRCSAKAPGAAVRFDHARKANRPPFLLCQAFVTLCAVVPCRDRPRRSEEHTSE